MKQHAIPLIAFCLSPLTCFAANSWQCDSTNIEGMGVTEAHGKLNASVSWDCFPGDGICNQNSLVQLSSEEGNTVFEGPYYKLVIETKSPGNDGEYHAHISATDMTDPSDMGRGLTLDEEVSCKQD